MANNFERFGTDLRLLGDLERQNSRSQGSDLFTRTRPETGQVDLATLAQVENLQQALLLRFLTPVGELAQLGHPDYGCRLYELIGEPNTETNRNRAKLYTLLALQAEPRVKEVLTVSVTTRRQRPTEVDIRAKVKVIDSDTVLNLVFPFFFEGAAP
ncbi:GPW/gp25 family protein [Geoalkalibacter halelectricus]|uniref:GPW/gp25 family protein n=1 Tax=Geoalkalibacter halelectricus TaxID=2847045 RepID=A0ABY5ZQF4_9BACT|nr:GPW/gp25 family protein [Geoalkalibacter halelectricus]MDO3379161.1 GPW/gp25 family protein [Geoalkalibacter halelectricus]UWZ80921.1 GPW/gp25 family protein [Geoalkalibacter halelectricus]